MFQIGSSLREARLRQELELTEAEQQTRIRAKYLAALEEERFELLPAEAYARAFLRSYAEFLGLDSKRYLDEYEAHFGKPEQAELAALRTQRPRRRAPAWTRAVVVLSVAAFVLAGLLAGVLALGRQGAQQHGRPLAPTRKGPRPAAVSKRPPPGPKRPLRAAAAQPVRVSGIQAFDPYGDRQEHDAEAAKATDGDPSSYWRTETYAAGLGKPGVGLVLDAGATVPLARLTLTTDTPGFTAAIEAGPSPTGPFNPVSSAQTVGTTTTFALRSGGARYYLVWITRLDHVAHLNEVRAVRLLAKRPA